MVESPASPGILQVPASRQGAADTRGKGRILVTHTLGLFQRVDKQHGRASSALVIKHRLCLDSASLLAWAQPSQQQFPRCSRYAGGDGQAAQQWTNSLKLGQTKEGQTPACAAGSPTVAAPAQPSLREALTYQLAAVLSLHSTPNASYPASAAAGDSTPLLHDAQGATTQHTP